MYTVLKPAISSHVRSHGSIHKSLPAKKISDVENPTEKQNSASFAFFLLVRNGPISVLAPCLLNPVRLLTHRQVLRVIVGREEPQKCLSYTHFHSILIYYMQVWYIGEDDYLFSWIYCHANLARRLWDHDLCKFPKSWLCLPQAHFLHTRRAQKNGISAPCRGNTIVTSGKTRPCHFFIYLDKRFSRSFYSGFSPKQVDEGSVYLINEVDFFASAANETKNGQVFQVVVWRHHRYHGNQSRKSFVPSCNVAYTRLTYLKWCFYFCMLQLILNRCSAAFADHVFSKGIYLFFFILPWFTISQPPTISPLLSSSPLRPLV